MKSKAAFSLVSVVFVGLIVAASLLATTAFNVPATQTPILWNENCSKTDLAQAVVYPCSSDNWFIVLPPTEYYQHDNLTYSQQFALAKRLGLSKFLLDDFFQNNQTMQEAVMANFSTLGQVCVVSYPFNTQSQTKGYTPKSGCVMLMVRPSFLPFYYQATHNGSLPDDSGSYVKNASVAQWASMLAYVDAHYGAKRTILMVDPVDLTICWPKVGCQASSIVGFLPPETYINATKDYAFSHKQTLVYYEAVA